MTKFFNTKLVLTSSELSINPLILLKSEWWPSATTHNRNGSVTSAKGQRCLCNICGFVEAKRNAGGSLLSWLSTFLFTLHLTPSLKETLCCVHRLSLHCVQQSALWSVGVGVWRNQDFPQIYMIRTKGLQQFWEVTSLLTTESFPGCLTILPPVCLNKVMVSGLWPPSGHACCVTMTDVGSVT